jgi:AraC-like DNA-binding protein
LKYAVYFRKARTGIAGLAGTMNKLTFSTDDLPKDLDDHARFKLWHDLYTAKFVQSIDAARQPDKPFFANFELAPFGAVVIGRFEGALSGISRNAQQVAAAPLESFGLTFCLGRSRLSFTQRGRELTFQNKNDAGFYSFFEPHAHRAEDGDGWLGVAVPRKKLLDRIPNADDLAVQLLDSSNDALRHLRRYLEFLLGSDGIGDDPALIAHVETTLVDLVALSLGAHGDTAEMARMRGLRYARVQAVLAEIQKGFAEPSFSVSAAAGKLGLSGRYVQDLLQETGVSFTERVLELRLQRARTMLADRRNDRLKVSDIALMCGFNETSHFNRCFRRRFGAAPTQYRGTAGHG